MNNTANQIDSLSGPADVVQPAYDKAGNMTTMPKAGVWTTANVLTWDAWNRPVKLTDGTEEIGYAYDALTRRTKKTTAAETRAYYYNNQWRAIEERVSDAVQAAYVWSPIDRWTMIRRKRSVAGTLDETRYVLKDYLDPVAIIDTTATVIERYGYVAFGPVRIMDPDFDPRTASTCAWNFLFHAEFLDLDSGLYNYGYRYFHPELGRWPSRDPIGERSNASLYGFTSDNPIASIDIYGLVTLKKCTFTVFAGHAGEQTMKAQEDEEKRKATSCDQVHAISCFGNSTGWFLWPTPEIRDKKAPDQATIGEELFKEIKKMEVDAVNECSNKNTCCSSVEIKVRCLPSGSMKMGMKGGSVMEGADKDGKGGKKVTYKPDPLLVSACNYSNIYKCKPGKWTGKLLENPNKKSNEKK